jgi:chromate transporter
MLERDPESGAAQLNQPHPTSDAPRGSLGEVARLFLKLGFTAFGGPAAHIAMFHDEFVKRRGWLTDQHFLDLLGATNLIPGPNSTEMTMHIGYVRAGWRGMLVAGACFILPASLIVLVLAVLYAEFGTTPAAAWLLYGIKPVIIAIVLQAIYSLGRKAVKTPLLAAVGVGTLILYLLGVNELLLLFGGALLVMVVHNIRRLGGTALLLAAAPPTVAVQVAASEPSLVTLFLTFFKIGSVLYGSGYVLLAFLRSDFVETLGWLTDQQLLDAISIGQFTPGPLFTTATFIGYQIGGLVGAVVATLGIFLPGFLLVTITNPIVPRLRQSPWLSALLDGVNAAAIGLMAAVTLELAQAAIIDPVTVVMAVAAAVALIRFKVNSTWLILIGGVIGIIYKLLAG